MSEFGGGEVESSPQCDGVIVVFFSKLIIIRFLEKMNLIPNTTYSWDLGSVILSPCIALENKLLISFGLENVKVSFSVDLELGRAFRALYPGGEGDWSEPGLGLLRLHSTYRHDLKIYASDEGRVQMTAAAFAKGFLALDGLLPVAFLLSSIVRQIVYKLWKMQIYQIFVRNMRVF